MALTMAAAGSLLAVAACNGDDGETEPTTETTIESTTTEAPETTEPPTTPPPTTQPPTTPPPTVPATTSTPTTSPEDALKAQIEADFELSRELLDELASNPTLDDLDARMSEIALPGSQPDLSIREFITGMVQRNERVVNGEPDYSLETVERIDLLGSAPYTQATVTSCYVSNRVRLDSAGIPQGGTGVLTASRLQRTVSLAPSGLWLSSDAAVILTPGVSATECPAP